MQQSKEKSTKDRIMETASSTLHSLRFVLLGIVIALFLFVLGFVIVGEIQAKRIEQSTTIVESIEKDLDTWATSEQGEEKDAAATKLLDRIAAVLDTYPHLYASQRALFLRAHLFFLTEAWEESRASFEELADRFPKSYLAPIALEHASSAMENAGRPEDAISLLQRVELSFSTPEMPAILFSLGRLNESTGNSEGAVSYYEKLLDKYPSSGWTNLARSRIITLKIDRP